MINLELIQTGKENQKKTENYAGKNYNPDSLTTILSTWLTR